MHGLDGAEAGQKHFRQVVQGRGVPDDVPEAELSLGGASDLSLLEVLVREFEGQSLVASRSEARRLASQGAISVEGQKVDDVQSPLSAGSHLIRVGKRRYLRLRLEE
jgi:tyrosyl-tRNA synthetase